MHFLVHTGNEVSCGVGGVVQWRCRMFGHEGAAGLVAGFWWQRLHLTENWCPCGTGLFIYGHGLAYNEDFRLHPLIVGNEREWLTHACSSLVIV